MAKIEKQAKSCRQFKKRRKRVHEIPKVALSGLLCTIKYRNRKYEIVDDGGLLIPEHRYQCERVHLRAECSILAT